MASSSTTSRYLSVRLSAPASFLTRTPLRTRAPGTTSPHTRVTSTRCSRCAVPNPRASMARHRSYTQTSSLAHLGTKISNSSKTPQIRCRPGCASSPNGTNSFRVSPRSLTRISKCLRETTMTKITILNQMPLSIGNVMRVTPPWPRTRKSNRERASINRSNSLSLVLWKLR